jgi:ABC-2 type transport system ATP-binding protein
VVRVRTPAARLLAAALARSGADVVAEDDGALQVSGLEAPAVGEVAYAAGVPLHELTRVTASLEAAYLALTHDEVEYRAVAR